MELWDKSSEIITMGSDKIIGELREGEKRKIRKSAQMSVLNIWHPDIEEFIVAKQTPNRLTKFNMSVGVYDDFMEALIHSKKWNLEFPDTEIPEYKLEWDGDLYAWKAKGYPTHIYKTVSARELWDLIMMSTYTRNEPGVLFLGTFNKLNPLAYVESILATNPCGEIGMGLGVCDLGSMNLTQYINKNSDGIYFDFTPYAEDVKTAVRYLDNINDISRTPLPEYLEAVQSKRRIGLGNMGLGSIHLMLGVRYGSHESLQLVEKIYKTKAEAEIKASSDLGKEKGSFPLFDKDKYFSTTWWKELQISPELKSYVEAQGTMRNSHRSMNAPTGNTGVFANNVSGGIEPVFALTYDRWSIVSDTEKTELRKKGFSFPNPQKGEWFETENLKFSNRGDEQILKGTFREIDYEVDKNRGLVKRTSIEDYGWEFAKNHYTNLDTNIFATTEQLGVMEHVNVLKIASHYTDMNNSKTTNVPAEYPYDDFKKLYLEAWKNNIKGLTTYREGTMTAVLERVKEETEEFQTELEKQFSESNGTVIPDVLKLPNEYYSKGFILRDNKKKKWYINIAFADSNYKKPFAIFVNTNNHEANEVTDEFITLMEELLLEKGISQNLVEKQREKYIGQRNTTKIARVLGMALRHNIALVDIIHVMEKYDVEISSFLFHLRKLLASFIPDGTRVQENCPHCGRNSLVYEQRCKICTSCSWTAC